MSESTFRSFIDGTLGAAVGRGDLPGAAVVLVREGRIVAAPCYGLADAASGRRVDPNTTRFRVGSISKLITALAVLRCAGRDQLSLDDDVQHYLPGVPLGPAGAGVTFRHLLTHTDGFDVGWPIGGGADDPRLALPVPAFLRANPPVRIAPPGTQYVYGDVGMTLAGQAVEHLIGVPFARLAREEVLRPLGMDDTTFEQPLPPDAAAALATGYRRPGGFGTTGPLRPQPFDFVYAAPAGAMTTTPADAARLMIALLDDGAIDGRQAVPAGAVRAMKRRQFAPRPELAGTGFALYERPGTPLHVLQHGGTLPGYSSLMVLLPDQRVGLFITCNNFGVGGFDAVAGQFLDRFFPTPVPAAADAGSGGAPPAVPAPPDVEGRYRYMQYTHASVGKLMVLTGVVPEIYCHPLPDGRLSTGGADQALWTHDGNGLFRRGDERLAVRRGPDGRVAGISVGLWGYERIASWESFKAQRLAVALMALTFVLAAVGRPITWCGERRHARKARAPRAVPSYGQPPGARRPTRGRGTPRVHEFGERTLIAERHARAPGTPGVIADCEAEAASAPRGEIFVGAGRRTRVCAGHARGIAFVAAGVNVTFLAGLAWAVCRTDLVTWYHGMPPVLVAVLWLPRVAAVLACATLLATALSLTSPDWNWPARVRHALVTAALLAFLPFCAYWNLLAL